jgi:hypothetical protein
MLPLNVPIKNSIQFFNQFPKRKIPKKSVVFPIAAKMWWLIFVPANQ